jgi:hypothetical protein
MFQMIDGGINPDAKHSGKGRTKGRVVGGVGDPLMVAASSTDSARSGGLAGYLHQHNGRRAFNQAALHFEVYALPPTLDLA